jgi:hypothetical protein
VALERLNQHLQDLVDPPALVVRALSNLRPLAPVVLLDLLDRLALEQ